jgi:DnaK suppressor protein
MAAQNKKRGPVMRTETGMSEEHRQTMLREMLNRLRDETYQRVSDFRRDQRDSVVQQGDEMDVARLSTDAETKANLIERAEERLRYIDQALGRLERGNYGTCAECGESIPIERLMAVPFAIYCVDCQQRSALFRVVAARRACCRWTTSGGPRLGSLRNRCIVRKSPMTTKVRSRT